MSKQNKDDEEAVPIPTSFEVDNDKQWAAEHTEFEKGFVSLATSEESDGDILNTMYPNFVNDEAAGVDEQPVFNDGLVLDDYADAEGQPYAVDEQPAAVTDDDVVLPPHVNELGLPHNVEEELPRVNSDGLVLPAVNSDGVISVPEDEEEMMSVVGELGGEIISVMAEETLNKTGSTIALAKMSISTTFEELNGKFDELNDDATALIFPEPQDSLPEPNEDRITSFVEDEPSTRRSSGASGDSVSAADSVSATDSVSADSFSANSISTYESTWSKKVMDKMMRRKYMQEESVMSPITEPESREPEESLGTEDEREDDDGVWSFMDVCGGLRQSIESTNDRVTDYVFPYNHVDLVAEMQQEEEARRAMRAAAAARVANDVYYEKNYKEKKSFKDKIKSGKMKNLFRRRRSFKKQCELLA